MKESFKKLFNWKKKESNEAKEVLEEKIEEAKEEEKKEVVVTEVVGKNDNEWTTRVLLNPYLLPSAACGGEPNFAPSSWGANFAYRINHIVYSFREITHFREVHKNCNEFLLKVTSTEKKDARFPYVYAVSGSPLECCTVMKKMLEEFVEKAKANPESDEAMSIPCIESIIGELAKAIEGNGLISDEVKFHKQWEDKYDELIHEKRMWERRFFQQQPSEANKQ